MNAGSRILSLNPLIEAAHWLINDDTCLSKGHDTTWNVKGLHLHFYSITTKEWNCQNCTLANDVGDDQCSVCGSRYSSKRSTEFRDGCTR